MGFACVAILWLRKYLAAIQSGHDLPTQNVVRIQRGSSSGSKNRAIGTGIAGAYPVSVEIPAQNSNNLDFPLRFFCLGS
jgi:hypothetical protein